MVLIGSKETKEQIQKQKQNRHNQLMLLKVREEYLIRLNNNYMIYEL